MPDSQIDEIIKLIFEAKKLTQDSKKFSQRYSPLHLRTLLFISANPNTVMKDIADLFGIAPPSATSLIEGMVKSGFIARSEDKTDRRNVRLHITRSGSLLLRAGLGHFKRKIRKVLKELTRQEQATLMLIIKKLSNN
ncbi:MAG: MarR family transcriptional regulator [Candidatus Doudnabacteria bacterium]